MKVLRIVIVCILAMGLLALVSFAEEETYTLRFNTTSAPSEPQTLGMQKFAEVVGELSGGKIVVKVFHSGALGDQKTSLLNIMKGTLEMSTDASPSFFVDLCNYPEIGVLEVPYAFRDLDHLYRVLTGAIGQKYWDYLAETSGIRVIDVWYTGTRELNLTKRAGVVRRPEDLKGIILRMPGTETWLDVGRALGAEPTPLGFGEVYMALKTGTIDGQENPLPTDYAAKFCEVTHYIVLTDHMIGYVTPIINEKLWKEMPEKYRVYIKKAIMVARFYVNRIVLEQEVTLLGKFVRDYGMEIIIPDKESFMESARKFYTQPRFSKIWEEGMYEKIQSAD